MTAIQKPSASPPAQPLPKQEPGIMEITIETAKKDPIGVMKAGLVGAVAGAAAIALITLATMGIRATMYGIFPQFHTVNVTVISTLLKNNRSQTTVITEKCYGDFWDQFTRSIHYDFSFLMGWSRSYSQDGLNTNCT